MPTGDRSKTILTRVQAAVAGLDQGSLSLLQKTVTPTQIFDLAQEAQRRLATELLCLEKDATVTFTSGVGAEPTGFYRLKQIQLPTTQTWQPTEVSAEQYDDLLRGYFSGGQTPAWFWRWNGSIRLFPVPATGDYTVYYYGIPTTTISVSVDPETPSYMDDALMFYAIRELAVAAGKNDLVGFYGKMFESERDRLQGMWRKSKSVLLEIEPGPYL